ncbi:hypothetical protein JXB11_01330 [Candidatus Woesearchaeota archaeon]|nr:hypothetical protein [Candidatus Woesearchaeota archaeon]
MERNEIRKWAKERVFRYDQLKKRKRLVFLAVICLALLLFFWAYVKAGIVLLLLILLGFASLLYNKFVRISLGFEFIVLSTVLAGVIYGPLAAFFVGAVALFAAEVFNQSFQHSTLVSFIGLGAVSIAIPLFEGMGITSLGILMAILYNVIIVPGYILLGSQPWKSFLFAATDIPFNIWVFAVIAPKLLELLG